MGVIGVYPSKYQAVQGLPVNKYVAKADLESTDNGQGASLVGIEDAGSYFIGTDVESALQELGASIVAEDLWDRDSGNGYMYLKNSGDNVGIGTSTPSYKLTVKETNTDTSGTDYGVQTDYTYTPSGAATGTKAANQVNLTTSGSSAINAEVIGNFIIATHAGSQQIGNLYAQNFRVDNISTGGIFNAWGTFADIFNSTSASSILNATSFFARVANLSTGTITNAKPARFIVQNNTSGTITNSVCGSFEVTDVSGGTFTSILLNEFTAMPSFTANNQTRVGLKIAAIPDPGVYTGTTEAGIWFNSDSGDARDGIFWGASLDTNLYRSAAGVLTTDGMHSANAYDFNRVAANPGDTDTLWQDDGTNYDAGTLVWENKAVILDEVSIGDPGNEQGGITVNGASFDAIAKINEFGGTRDASLILHRHATNASTTAALVFARARGNTSSHTVVQNGDVLGQLDFVGYNGNDYSYAAAIDVEVDGTPGNNDMPARIVFKVSPDGSQTPAEAMRISQDKKVLMAGDLEVDGDYYSADGSQGFTGSWTNAEGDTVTVKNGIITNVS